MNAQSLLLEIGAEEIPAGYIEPALEALAANLAKRFAEARITHGAVETFGTPRRLAVRVESVFPRQETVTAQVMGPPESVAFDARGEPTMAAGKFAEKVGLPLRRVKVVETPKGRYLCADKTEKGLATRSVLKSLLPQLILSIPFPKTMRWADLEVAFARPIHTIVALLGEDPVRFTLGNVTSGRYTRGHRFMHPAKIRVTGPDTYLEQLLHAHVEADIEKRRQMVHEKVTLSAQALGGNILPDPALLDIVTHLVEKPFPVVGRFEDRFLVLPPEILITAMREHQKYFAVTDATGKLMPLFVAVNNTLASDMTLVTRGHERVIRARLSDARFFYEADTRKRLDDWVEKLSGVLFQAKLGNMREKTARVTRIAETIAEWIKTEAPDRYPADLGRMAGRAATLSKADLVSEVVGEFPNLQGIMGRVYALLAGEPQAVATAIEEHYRPTHSGGKLPETVVGAVVAVADKIDSICGCFSANLAPTGASDPYALRRQAIGLVQIFLDQGWLISLKDLVVFSLSRFPAAPRDTGDKVLRFFGNRIEQMLVDQGFSRDVVAAVLAVSIDPVPHCRERVRALEALKSDADFDPLATAFKRVVNIIRKADTRDLGEPDASLFKEKSEERLYAACLQVEKTVLEDLSAGRFEAALKTIAAMKPDVDAFFDDVMVMADDPAERHNRLSLLGKIAALFDRFADFTKLST